MSRRKLLVLWKGGDLMFKFKGGPITNPKTNQTKDVIAVISKTDVKDILIGGSLIIAGTIYLVGTSFRNGAKAYDLAEYNTLKELGLIR